MAKLEISFRSECLGGNTEITVLLPEKLTEDIPVLYLLHGMRGDHTSWMNGSTIGWEARARGIAVVMPSGGNSFYSNMKYGPRYYDYVATELPAYLEKLLPAITKDPKKTFVAGLSMGGYGAIKLALRNPGRFAAAASLSGALDLVADVKFPGWSDITTANWGEDYDTSIAGTDDDLLALLDRYPADVPKPRIYFTCGTEDFLYEQNRTFRERIAKTDFDYTYSEGPGIHNWAYWNAWLVPALDHILAPITPKG